MHEIHDEKDPVNIPNDSSDGSENQNDNDDDSNDDSDSHPTCGAIPLFCRILGTVLIRVFFGIIQRSLDDELQIEVVP